MDPIPEIYLHEYDLSYELQFTEFLINLLEPYIRFVYKSEALEIYKKRGDTSLLIEESISVKEYVYFIQTTFPTIIDTEIRLLEPKICSLPLANVAKHRHPYSIRGEYLKRIKHINSSKNGKVKDVLKFLDNLQYIYDKIRINE